jgi:hypothetical protein
MAADNDRFIGFGDRTYSPDYMLELSSCYVFGICVTAAISLYSRDSDRPAVTDHPHFIAG